MSRVNYLVAALLLLVATVAQAAEVVGKVGYMSGMLMAKRADGTVKIMGTKAEVLTGDLLSTAKDSYAQILMNDGGKMTLRPNSNLKIEDYRFNKEEPKSDSAVFNLIKGGLRSVTGQISKRGNPDAYKLKTQVATIGIRGTDFSSRLCATQNCQDDAEAKAKPADCASNNPSDCATGETSTESPPGLYVTVHTGQVIVAQPGNTLSLGQGETGFANLSALVRLPTLPPFMNTDTKQTNAIEAKASKAEEGKNVVKPDEGNANNKPGKKKESDKQDEEKNKGQPDVEKNGSNSDKEKNGGKPDAGKNGINPETNSDSTDPSINKSGCVVR